MSYSSSGEGESKPLIKRKLLQWAFFVAIILVIILLSYRLRNVLNPLLICLLIAYIINPAIVFFEKRGIKRIVVVSVFFALLVLTFLAIIFAVVPLVTVEASYFYKLLFVGDIYEGKDEGKPYQEGSKLIEDIDKNGKYTPPLITVAEDKLKELVAGYIEKYPQLKEQIDSLFETIKIKIQGLVSIKSGQDILNWVLANISSGINTIFLLLFYLIMIPVYIFFLLQNLDKIRNFIYSYFPQKYKEKIIHILKRIDSTVSSFTRGLLLKCLIKGIVTVIGLYIAGSSVPFLFGFIQVIASLIPFLPLFVGAMPATVIASLQYGLTNWHTLCVVGVFVFAEIVEGLILTPFVVGKKCRLNPLVVIISLLIGAELAGLFGVLIAIPGISIVKILWEEVIHPNIMSILNPQ